MKNRLLSILIVVLLSNSLFAQSQTSYDTITIGNIQQVISYTGSKDLPIILFLHGGPGSSRMKQADVFSNILQEHFLVVQWDQRETGRTLALNKTSVPITLELMENDTYELINLLLKKFKQEKLYLVGESWGTVLGFKMTEKHPQLLNAYIAFSPVVNQIESEQILLEELKLFAKEKGNTIAQNELKAVELPYKDYEHLYFSRRWMLEYDGHQISDKDTTALKQYLGDWSKTWLRTWNQAMLQNLSEDLPKIDCPVYFFLGGKDLQTNFNVAKDYFKILQAPKKKIFLFKTAGHSVLTEEAEQVQTIIVEDILKAN